MIFGENVVKQEIWGDALNNQFPTVKGGKHTVIIYNFITQKRSFKPKGTQVSQIGRQDMLPQLETKLYSRFIRFTAPHETSVSRGKAGHPEIKNL